MEVADNQGEIGIGALKMEDLAVHVADLLLHLGYLLLSRPDVPLELFNFVVEHELELFELLRLLLQLEDASRLVLDSLLSLLDLLPMPLLLFVQLLVLLLNRLYLL